MRFKRIAAVLVCAATVCAFSACKKDGDKKPGKYEPKDFNYVVFKFNDREFAVAGGAEVLLGDNLSDWVKNGDDRVLERNGTNGAADTIVQAFQQPLPNDPEYPNRFIIAQNGDFWSSVDRIEAKFYIEGADENAKPEDYKWIGTYIQLGKTANYKFDFTGENTLESLPEGFGFGPDYTMSVHWDIAGFIKKNRGNTDAGDPADDDGGGGGIHKFGMKIRNEDVFDYTLKIVWTDVEVFVSDKAKFDEYVAKVSEITGESVSADAKITYVD